MGLQKLLNKLGRLIDGDKVTPEENCEEIRELLEKLEKKSTKLQKKIEKESSNSKRKSLKLEFKITTAELKKGYRLLRKKCS